MARHFDRAILKIKNEVFSLSALVEESVAKAVRSVEERNIELAESVMAGDAEIDAREVEIEEECLKALALNQPVANDLRFIVAIIKLNNDLERIGDLAAGIAWRARSLATIWKVDLPLNLGDLANKTKVMLRKALDGLVNLDVTLARDVLASEEAVDERHRSILGLIQDRLKSNPDETEALLYLIGVSRSLERIADHATYIAEDIIYIIEGEIVRHGL